MASFEVDVMEMFYKPILRPDLTAFISSRHNLLGHIRCIYLRLVASYQPVGLARATIQYNFMIRWNVIHESEKMQTCVSVVVLMKTARFAI
jgi:hypothetical protein